jgi:phosphoglucosamine mutase
MKKLFGTDGIRGRANTYPMTCEMAMALGRAVTFYFQNASTSPRKSPLVIIGKDTRLSCYMFEQAFASGVCSQGGRAIFTGPLPTPGVAYVTSSMRADAGVMISASHNPYYDNGIKIFDHSGHKLPDHIEQELERLVLNQDLMQPKINEDLGKAKRLDEVIGRYIVQVKNAYKMSEDLKGLRIILDCANGASYRVAPMVFEELGAEVISIGISPNGTNINEKCGALYPENCAEKVLNYRADLGVCFDGDADRLIMVDEKGKVVHGDKLIAVMAKYLLDSGEIKKGSEIVGTLMTNSALESYFTNLGLKFFRAQVGDRYIVARMLESGSSFGGEPSGHLIFKDYSTTGDGILAALKVIECLKFYKKTLSELLESVPLYPQVMINVLLQKKVPFEEIASVQQKLIEVEKKLKGHGRVLLRYSGTENLARVMVEGKDQNEIEQYATQIAELLKKEIGN